MQEDIKASTPAGFMYVPPPQPSLNGGLFTGTPFLKGAPWGNVPVIPDVDYMTNVNLKSANPPPGAIYQYPGNTRPGNNYQKNTGLQPYKGRSGNIDYNFACAPCDREIQNQKCKCKQFAPISGNTTTNCECANRIYVEV